MLTSIARRAVALVLVALPLFAVTLGKAVHAAPPAGAAASASASGSSSSGYGIDAPPATSTELPTVVLPAGKGSPEVPAVVSLADALKMFHEKGYDLLVADAAISSAEGDVKIAGQVINPSINAAAGNTFYDPNYVCAGAMTTGCSNFALNVGISDNGAIIDNLINKRGLRLKVARAALEVVRTQRKDAERTIDVQVKTAWINLVQAFENWRFARQVQILSDETLERNRARFPGKIDEGSLARIETAKLEADRQVDLADQSIRLARVSLAYLIGVRTKVPEFGVPENQLVFKVPGKIGISTVDSLISLAKDHRPDLAGAVYNKERASASIDLAKRTRWPDISLSLTYSMTGTGNAAVQPPTVLFGVGFTLPVFYLQEGEIKKAEADLWTQKILETKTVATITSDVTTAYEGYVANKKLVERFESGGYLERAKKARDITESQYRAGKANLTDFLDAQRAYVATRQEYIQDLGNYWTAIYQLETAVGMDLR